MDETESANSTSDSYEGLREEVIRSLPGFTFVGRLVILVYVLLALGGSAGTIVWLYESLPPGSYPIVYFVLPWALISFVLCALTLHLLKKRGVQVYRQQPNSD